MLPTGRGRSLKKRSWPVVTRKRSPRRSCDLRMLCSGDVLLIDSQNSLCSLASLASLTVYSPASQHGVFVHSRSLTLPASCLSCSPSIDSVLFGLRPCSSRTVQESKTPDGMNHRAFYSGDVLLSHGLSPYYHRGCSVSLPCSEWERVVPLRYCHQSGEALALLGSGA